MQSSYPFKPHLLAAKWPFIKLIKILFDLLSFFENIRVITWPTWMCMLKNVRESCFRRYMIPYDRVVCIVCWLKKWDALRSPCQRRFSIFKVNTMYTAEISFNICHGAFMHLLDVVPAPPERCISYAATYYSAMNNG